MRAVFQWLRAIRDNPPSPSGRGAGGEGCFSGASVAKNQVIQSKSCHEYPDPHDSGHHLRCRQKRHGRRLVPVAGAARRARGSLQTPEYGPQQRRDRGRRRNRPRPGGAGASGFSGTAYRHESGAAQAQHRHRRPSHHPRQGVDQHGCASLSRLQAGGDAGGAGILRTAARRLRRGAGGRRRQPGGNQFARQGHRQHGLRRGGGLSGVAGRRHRPGRRVRPLVRDAGAVVAERTGADYGTHHQSLPGRREFADAGAGLADPGNRQAGTGCVALFARVAFGSRGRPAPRTRRRQGFRAVAGGGAGAGADQQSHRFRSLATASTSRGVLGATGRRDSTGRSDHPARQQKHARRLCTDFANRVGIRIFIVICATAAN